MLLVLPVFVAIVAALLRGGSLRHLALLPVRGSGFLLSSFAIQLLLYAPIVRTSPVSTRFGGIIYIVALGLVLIGALRNRHLGVAVRVATLGLALNALVIVLNDGHMPVNGAAMAVVRGPAEVQDIANQQLYGNTALAQASSRLVPLSDVLPLRLPGGGGNVYSIGDLLLTLGIVGTVYRGTRAPYGGLNAPLWRASIAN
jgi:hypothetical protein